ncbi:tape measure protein [Lactococcus garvieae]|uniref:tape measure protein n=1 Tax=Lactococcus garvieae TaxID=1363 RepID=UPI0018D86AC7|nr:tape measure protein [Lactococcus garvieae]QPS70422.1 tape measure protein [Lactococcus garvieae]
MSESYTVSATLSAKDQGFTSTMKAGLGALDSLTAKAAKSGSIFKSVLGANVIGSGITKGLSLVSTGVRGLVSELDESSKAWQVFQGNMEELKMPTKDIQAAKKDMQQFATQTIYSASDMASTYSQLAAVGIKNTGELVKGFGGLAAASSEPTQAMKTLSQQATQMAAKPMVQWQDFKLMLEQTPAGISAVAKTMGMSTKDLVKNVQDGKVKTQEFFDAITKTGTNANFTKMATQFKSVGQAVDGLKEGLSNKLMPIFERVSKKGIELVTNLSDAIEKIDFEKIANKAMRFVGNIKKGFSQIWSGFKDSGAISALSSAFSAIGAAIKNVKSALSGGVGEGLKNLGSSLGGLTSKAAGVIESVANAIAKMSPGQINQVVGALKAAATAMIAFKVGSMAFQKGLAVYNGVAKTVGVIKTLTSALKGLSSVQGGKGTKALADIPTAPATSKLSGWTGIAKSVGIIVAIGGSMKLVASAFKDMANIRVSWGQLGKNLAQMGTFLLAAAVSMGVIGGAIQLFPPIATALAIGAGVFVGLAETMGLVGKGLESFAKSSDSAIKTVNNIKFDKNFSKKLVELLGAMAGLSAVGSFAGIIGGLSAPFAVLGAISFTAISATITKISKFATELDSMNIPEANVIKPKLKQVQDIANALASFKVGNVGNIGAVFSTAFANLSTGNIIGTFKKVSDFVQEVSKMPSIDSSVLQSKFKMLADVRNELNKITQSNSTGGTSIDAAINSWFGKLDTSNLVASFQKVTDLVKKISSMETVDASSLDAKFKTIKDVFEKIRSFSKENFDSSIFDSLNSLFGKMDTSNLVNSFTKVADLTNKIANLPTIDSGVIDTKFKAIKNVFTKLHDFKIESYTGDTSNLSSYNKIISAINELSGFVQKLASTNIVDISGKLNQIKTTITQLSKFTVPAPPENLTQTLDNVKKTVTPLGEIATSMGTIANIPDLSAIGPKIDQIKAAVNKIATLVISPMASGLKDSITGLEPVISSITTIARSLQAFSGVVINGEAISASLNTIKSVLNNGVWDAMQTGLSKLGTMETTFTSGTTAFQSLKTMVSAMNNIPAASTAIQANVDNIQKGLDKLSGINFSADIAGKAAQYAAAVNSLISSLKGMGGNFSPVGNEWASKITQGFVSGISSSTGRATSAIRSLISAVRGAGASSAGQFQSVGAMIGAGLASGMYSALGQVRAAADALVAEANRAAQAKAKIHSPSRLFRDEVGWYIGAGVAVGISKSTATVVGATKQLTNKTLSAATAVLPKLQTVSTKMLDAVTPDLSSLSNFARDSRARFESKLNANYSYNQPIYVTAEVISTLDGKEVGYGTARYVKQKNDAEDARHRRLGGKI